MPSQDNTRLETAKINPLDFLKTVRKDDTRIAEKAKSITSDELSQAPAGWVVIGHPDDEGVHLNFGRIGAKTGPENIRRFLYNLVELPNGTPIYDLGNDLLHGNLEQKHSAAHLAAKSIFPKHKLISLGGGHDYGYPDGKAFLQSFAEGKQLLILNIDAHLDLRPSDPHHHSGTPFRRLCDEHSNFEIVQYGIQGSFASKQQLIYAESKAITVVTYEERKNKLAVVLEKIRSSTDIFLSVDIDAFSSSIAPGASAAWPVGLSWEDAEPIFEAVFRSRAFRGMGVYEVAPELDIADRTSKLAAQIIDRALRAR